MQVSTEKKEGILNLITVTVPAEDVKSARSNVFKNYAKNAKIDGFRKGHIPTAVLEKNFSAQINGDTLDRVINDNIYEAIQESKLKVVDIVKVDLKSGDATSEVVF